MEKGRLGVNYAVLATLAFIAVFFESFIALLLIAGFLVAYEKNEWLTKQVVAAVTIYVFFTAAELLLDRFLGFVSWFLTLAQVYNAFNVINTIEKVFGYIFGLGMLIAVVISIILAISNKNNPISFIYDKVKKEKKVKQDTKTEPKKESNIWICECGAENDGVFCSRCGKQKV